MQERCEKSKNIIIHNIAESNSINVNERIEFDRIQVESTLKKLGDITDTNFKVYRIGRQGKKMRPIRVILSSQEIALECLKQKKKLNGSSINISADRTTIQRAQLKELYKEINHRKENGEHDLIISYHKGYPQITKKRISRE